MSSRLWSLLPFALGLVIAALLSRQLALPATLWAARGVEHGWLHAGWASLFVQFVRDGAVLLAVVGCGLVLAQIHRRSLVFFLMVGLLVLAVGEWPLATRHDNVVAAWSGLRLWGRLSAVTLAVTVASFLDWQLERPAHAPRRWMRRLTNVVLLVPVSAVLAPLVAGAWCVTSREGFVHILRTVVFPTLFMVVGIRVRRDDGELDWSREYIIVSDYESILSDALVLTAAPISARVWVEKSPPEGMKLVSQNQRWFLPFTIEFFDAPELSWLSPADVLIHFGTPLDPDTQQREMPMTKKALKQSLLH